MKHTVETQNFASLRRALAYGMPWNDIARAAMSVAGRIPAGLALPANKVFKVLKVLNDLKDPKDLKVICGQSQTCTPDDSQ